MSISFKKVKKVKTVLDLTDTLPFGKYQGETIFDTAHKDSAYLVWLMENSGLEFSETVLNLVKEIEYDTYMNFIANGQNVYFEDVPF